MNEVVETQKNLPTTGIDYSADAGLGLEGADRDSYAIPFLVVLQPMSPQVDTVEGAKPGMLLNSVTNDVYESALIIPCAFQRRWVRWAPRETGGGFKGELSTAEVNELRQRGAVKDLEGRLYFPEADGSVNPKRCDRLADTRNHYCLVLRSTDDTLGVPAVFSLTSTGIKVSKNFLSRIEGIRLTAPSGKVFNPPSFSHMYRVKTVLKTNDQGKWWQPEIAPEGPVRDAGLYAAAKAFHTQATAGKVDVAHDSVRGGTHDDAADDGRM